MIYTNPKQFHRLHETQVVQARGVRDDPKVLAALQRGPIFGASGGSGNVAANVFRLRSSGHNIQTHYVRTAQNKMVSIYELTKPVCVWKLVNEFPRRPRYNPSNYDRTVPANVVEPARPSTAQWREAFAYGPELSPENIPYPHELYASDKYRTRSYFVRAVPPITGELRFLQGAYRGPRWFRIPKFLQG